MISDVAPVLDCGRRPAKAVVGETFEVSATVFREGHEVPGAGVVLRGPDGRRLPLARMRETLPGLDRYAAEVTPDAEGRWRFHVEAWGDPIGHWHHDAAIKVPRGQDVELMLAAGALLFDRAARSPSRPLEHRSALAAVAVRLGDRWLPPWDRLAAAEDEGILAILHEAPLRELLTRSAAYPLVVHRLRALYGAWYEFFPRAEGVQTDPMGRREPQGGTLRTAMCRLEPIAKMGFDVVYLPPVHPIGTTARKGRNNSPTAAPGDVGSPWAIGSDEGGHDAVHPSLGTIDDFDAFVAAARDLGLEVSLDLALQCAPDHPWAREHRRWFTELPDGTIAYAENPPKKYQDIYPLNFDNDPAGLYDEVLRVVRHWIDHGVKFFRVDNPHTKPPDFWAWLIGQVKATDPDVLFLSEAFTPPARQYGLAKLGFTQSYSYFTWRTAKWELTEFGNDIAALADFRRPNLFVNTPDILHAVLQHNGPGMFAIRAVLAATMSPAWGVYSGYELFEHRAVREGSEEYLDSEKYELRPRDFAGELAAGRSLEPFLKKLNAIRRLHPALEQLRTIYFHHVDDDALLAYSKFDPVTGDCVLVVVTLNAYGPEEATLWLDMDALGMESYERFWVRDEITGTEYQWGQSNYIRIDPGQAVAHIINMPLIPPEARITLLRRR